MAKVIEFRKDDESKIPEDLMTLKEIQLYYGIKYQYLYKWACTMGKIKVYHFGKLKLSVSEVLEFERKRGEKYGVNRKKAI